MSRLTKVMVLLLVVAIVLVVVAPQLDLASAVARTHPRATQLVMFVFVSLAAALLIALTRRAMAFEREPLPRSTPIFDLTCVRLC